MVEIVRSVRQVPIRLTTERWQHITEEHCELEDLRAEVLETVASPARIYAAAPGNSWLCERFGQGNILLWFTGKISRTASLSLRS